MPAFTNLLAADLSGGFDEELIAYAALVAKATSGDFSLVLPPSAALHLTANSPRVQSICSRESVDDPIYRMLLEPDLDSLYDLAWHCEADVLLLRYSSGSAGSRRWARRVVRTAPCSVWLMPDGHSLSLFNLVVGFMPNERGAKVMESAAALAHAAGADGLIAAHVWLDPTHLDPTDAVHKALRLEQIRVARRFLWGLDLNGVECTVRTEHSCSRAQPTVRAALESRADLLVLPAPEVSGVGFALHRDETDIFLRSGLPVLFVRARNEYRATLSDLWRDLFYLPEPAFG